MPSRPVIVNTSPLFYLHRIKRLELLQQLYGTVMVPEAVRSELAAGQQKKIPVPNLQELAWIEVKSVRSPLLIPAVVDLGPGETEVLALGLEHPRSLLIIDDRVARRLASLNKLTVTGTLGVVIKAKQRGLLQDVGQVLRELQANGLWLSEELIKAALAVARENPGNSGGV
jgi:predicted nucleic acid-binding protein